MFPMHCILWLTRCFVGRLDRTFWQDWECVLLSFTQNRSNFESGVLQAVISTHAECDSTPAVTSVLDATGGKILCDLT